MEQYLPIVLLLVLSIVFAAGMVATPKILGPSRITGAKEGPYESGIAPGARSSVRFPVRFFMVAMIFIIFDIEVVFLYPWAVVYRQLDLFGFGEMAAFAVVVFVSFAYLVSNGALDWGPRRRVARQRSEATRTTSSTVRRVPRPYELIDKAGAQTRPLGVEEPTFAPPAEQPAPVPPESEPVPAGQQPTS